MAKRKPTPEVDPIAFLKLAREFYTVAERSSDLKSSISKPLYFLYFHALELAFKAFFTITSCSDQGTREKRT